MHPPGRIALRHLLVDDSTARGHPLHVTRSDYATIPHAVPVLNGPRQHVSHGLDPAMRVPGKSRQIVFGDIVAEVVQEQEGVEFFRVSETEGAAEMYACSFECRLGLNQSLNRSKGHMKLQ